MSSQLRGAVNNVATQVAVCEPWTFVSKAPASVQASKELYSAWRANPSSEHLVYTATEATNPNIRASKQNPVRKLHGLIADFDTKITDETCASLFDRTSADLRPMWLSRTFSSGVRLVWMFEAPLALEQSRLAKEFLKVAFRELKIRKLFAGHDEPAFSDLTKLYDVGAKWTKISEQVISTNVLNYWLTEAAKNTRWDKVGEIIIPMEAVAAEAERQFPGRFGGEFAVGRRGTAFFNPVSTNPTAAIVTEAGMICFGEEQLFHPWSKIFGGSFIRKFQADKIGSAVANIYWDRKQYYRKGEDDVWWGSGKEDFVIHLKTACAMDASKERNASASEVEQTLAFIHNHKRVVGAIPRVYDPRDVIDINGQKYLNISYVRAMKPVEMEQEWGVNFPWLADFFDTCFDPLEQKEFFLAWWKRFYGSALAGDLLKGQAVFVAGSVDSGKTLLSNKIIGASVGGFGDASDHVAKGTEFNKQLIETGLWVIDDGQVASDVNARRKFSEMVKRLVANPVLNYRAMFKDAQSTTWNGRLFVTLNDDNHSIEMLPDLETSMEEKVLIFKFDSKGRVFPDKHTLESTICEELPYLLRWLIDWVVPGHVKGSSRLGVARYIHEELRTKSLNAGGVSDLLELVELWVKRCRVGLIKNHGTHWQGSASEWLADINPDEALRPLVSKFSVRQLGRKFVEAARIRDSRITIADAKGHGNIYRISLAEAELTTNKTVKCAPEVAA